MKTDVKNDCISAISMKSRGNSSLKSDYSRIAEQYKYKCVDHANSLIFKQKSPNNTLTHAGAKPKVNVTVVTAFFDIGEFNKDGYKVGPGKYFEWAKKLRHLQNPLVVFTDSEVFKSHVTNVRSKKSGKTLVQMFNRSTSWAFQNNERIKAIFSSPVYPKFQPNTVNSLYVCTQHAKFEVLAQAVKKRYFRTKFYMWLDVGYFRQRMSDKPFYLSRPRQFENSKIAMTLVDSKQHLNNQPQTIIKGNLVWVGGGVVFGDRIHIYKFAMDFKRAVEYFLTQGMINTDQQVIFAMYTPKVKEILQPKVQLQLYQPPQDWFYLGNSMVQEIS